MAILDADKEGFLRSETSLIQIIGPGGPERLGPSDHVRGRPDRLHEGRYRGDQPPPVPQVRYNEEHGIDPQTIRKKVSDILELVSSSSPSSRAGTGAWARWR